jgi:hypothetical protein
MKTIRAVGIGAGAILALGLAATALLLVYYRPTVEYAFIDIVDGSAHAISGWWLLAGVAVVLTAASLLVRRILRTRKS